MGEAARESDRQLRDEIEQLEVELREARQALALTRSADTQAERLRELAAARDAAREERDHLAARVAVEEARVDSGRRRLDALAAALRGARDEAVEAAAAQEGLTADEWRWNRLSRPVRIGLRLLLTLGPVVAVLASTAHQVTASEALALALLTAAGSVVLQTAILSRR